MEETKSKVVQVRVTPSIYAQIVRLANEQRKKPSTVLRDLALDRLEELIRARIARDALRPRENDDLEN